MKYISKFEYLWIAFNVANANNFLESISNKLNIMYSPTTYVYLIDDNVEFVQMSKSVPKVLLSMNNMTSTNIFDKINNNFMILVISNSENVHLKVSKFYSNLENSAKIFLITDRTNIEHIKDQFIDMEFWNVMIFSTFSSEIAWTNSLEIISPTNLNFLQVDFPNFYQKLFLSVLISKRSLDCKTVPFCKALIFFCQKYNITMVINDENSKTPSTITFFKSDLKLSYSRFMEYGTLEIYIPIKKELENHLYFIVPFAMKTWILLGISIITFSIFESFIEKKFDILNTFCILFAQARLKKNSIVKTNFVIFSLIISILYCANLGSSLFQVYTSTSKTVLCIERYIKEFSLNSRTQQNFKMIDEKEYWTLVDSVNTSFGYCLEKGPAAKFIILQKRLKKKIFKSMAFNTINLNPFAVVISKVSPFRTLIDNMIIEIFSAGLYKKWDEERTDVLNKPYIENEIFGITFSRFILPIKLYICGMFISATLFFIEIIFKHCKFVKK